MSNCPFCLGQIEPHPRLELVKGEQISVHERILECGATSYLAAGLGALVYPYVLFITKRHITGFAEANHAERLEFFEMLDHCLAVGLFPSKSLCVFEHGGSGLESCSCVDHCHIHIVDGAFDMAKLLAASKPAAVPWVIDKSTLSVPHVPTPYLWAAKYIQGESKIEGIALAAKGHGQQYFRRLLAAWIRGDQWDWRLFPRWDNIIKLINNWEGR